MGSNFDGVKWIWRNGEIIPFDDARIHVMSHVVHYGSSIFEGIRCYNTPDGPAVLRLRDHMIRFLDSAKIYRMDLGYSLEQLEAACLEVIVRNGFDACYIRPLSFRGMGAAGVNPLPSPVENYVICWPWGTYLGEGALEAGVDVCVSSWNRPAPNTFPTQAKAGGHYMNAQLIKMEAILNGFAEGIALTPGGLVSEGSGQNLFLVRNGELVTAPIDGSMLNGITRDCIIRLAQEEGIPVRFSTIPRETLYTADEVFFTGTAAEVTPVRSVDRIPVGSGKAGPMTLRLQKALLDTATGRRPDVFNWLTPVPRA